MTSQHQRTLTARELAALVSADRATLRAAIDGVPRDDLAALLATDAGETALRAAFARMPEFYLGERLARKVVRWIVDRPAPGTAVGYDVVLADGTCVAEPAGDATPDVTLTMDAVSFVELAFGVRSGMDLLMRGQLQVDGDAGLAMRLESLFDLGTGAETA